MSHCYLGSVQIMEEEVSLHQENSQERTRHKYVQTKLLYNIDTIYLVLQTVEYLVIVY